MQEELIFCLMMVEDNSLMLGLVARDDLDLWEEGKKKLTVQSPQKLVVMPERNGQDVMFKIATNALYPIQSEQKAISCDPITLEVLGQVKGEDVDGVLQVKELFEMYKDFSQAWRAQLSGIQIPTSAQAKNILDFNGKKQ